jgi:LAO/AO transport system kinase
MAMDMHRPEDYARGILGGERPVIARAITIVESNAPKHFNMGQEIIRLILPHTGKAKRIGVTGVPGAGKSTFIECIGNYLCDNGHKVAVLAVDPSSSVTKGSILGDKTRMVDLSRRKEAFIRPSPSGGTLGGITRKSRETMLICEAAGFDTVIVETVGVGQSEIAVRSMVDFFLVLAITGAGDDLQGIKKGIIENADAILVNKADGDNMQKALAARSEYEQVLHYLRPATPGWQTKAYAASSVTGDGIPEIWEVVCNFIKATGESGVLEGRRKSQSVAWMRQMVDEHVRNLVYGNPSVASCFADMEKSISEGTISPAMSAKNVIDTVENAYK